MPLEKLESLLAADTADLTDDIRELAKGVLRSRHEEIYFREKYSRKRLEGWDDDQLQLLLCFAVNHDPLWVFEDIIRDILDIWHQRSRNKPIGKAPDAVEAVCKKWRDETIRLLQQQSKPL